MRLRIVVGALMLCAATSVAAVEESAEQWLQKMVSAARQVNFEGQSVLVSGGRVTTLSIYHGAVDGEVWERVVHMSGALSEVIRKGQQVVCLHSRRSTKMAITSPVGRLTALEQGLQSAARFYRFERKGQDRVAGREAMRIDVVPKDHHRFGYSFWLDQATGILLKSQTNPQKGGPLDVFEFVSVVFSDKPDLSDFEVDKASAGFRSVTTLGSSAIDTPPASAKESEMWRLGWVPDGFHQSHKAMVPEQLSGVDARVYTDGLTAFTVFFEVDSGPIIESVRTLGTTVAINRRMGRDLVTVVGEIPLETAQKVASSAKVMAPSN